MLVPPSVPTGQHHQSAQPLSDQDVLGSITLALASTADGFERDLTTNMNLDRGNNGDLVGDSRSTDNHIEEFNRGSRSTLAIKRGRGRPKGSLDRMPRASRAGKSGSVDDSELGEVGQDVFDNDPAYTSAKRRPGRPRKPTGASVPVHEAAAFKPGTSLPPYQSSSKKPSQGGEGPNPMSAERREANRLAAERSRLRQAERATILETMAKGMTQENIELKSKINALMALAGSTDKSVTSPQHPQAADWQRTGHKLALRTNENRSTVSVPTGSTVIVECMPCLQSEIEDGLQRDAKQLEALLNGGVAQAAASYTEEIGSTFDELETLEDIARRLETERQQSLQKLSRCRAELLQLRVSADHPVSSAEHDVDAAQVHLTFAGLEAHVDQLLAHYDPVPSMKSSQMFTLPAKFSPIPLPEPLKRGRPSKVQEEKTVRRRTNRALNKVSTNEHKQGSRPTERKVKKRPEQFRRFRVEGDPDNIYIEKRQPAAGAPGEIVEVISRRIYNPRPDLSGFRHRERNRSNDLEAHLNRIEPHTNPSILEERGAHDSFL